MKPFPGGMQNFMKQVTQMQNRAEKLQAELKARDFTSTSGGGVVTATVNGDYQLTQLAIKPEVLKDGDVEMLQDLVTTAVNEALKAARTTSEQEMSKLTGGMNFPGMF